MSKYINLKINNFFTNKLLFKHHNVNHLLQVMSLLLYRKNLLFSHTEITYFINNRIKKNLFPFVKQCTSICRCQYFRPFFDEKR